MAVISEKCPEIKVTLVDLNKQRISDWNSDNFDLPVYEPNLKPLIEKNRNKNLFFTTEIREAIMEADIIFISVNTPTKEKGLGAGYASDLKWVESSARSIAKYAQNHTIVVEKSTVPVRTAELIKKILSSSNIDSKKLNCKKTFSVLSSPEFLAEGTAIKDLENPDRVLIGGEDHEALEQLSLIYQRWIPKNKIFITSLWSSELAKLTANAFLAQRISSINAISSLCEHSGADVREVSKAIGADSRIGEKFLTSGPGFGGSCFQKDLLNLVYLCRYYRLEQAANYWEQVIFLNEWQKMRISELSVETFFGTFSSKKITILGFAFKSNTNDTRYSPSITVAKNLIENGANLFIHDPKVSKNQIKKILGDENLESAKNEGNWNYSKDIKDACIEADAIIILTEWDVYKKLNWHEISNLMRKPSWLFDTRGIIDESIVLDLDLNLWTVGKGFVKSNK